MRRSLTLARLAPQCALLVFLGPRGPAFAAEGYELRWSAPEECPSQREVEERTDALLVASRSPPRQPIQGDAVVRAADGGTWALDLTVRRGEVADHRVLVADHCPALADAVALVIAVFVDPVAVGDAFTMIEPDPQRVPLPEPPRAPASTSTRAAPQALVRPQEPSVARPKNPLVDGALVDTIRRRARARRPTRPQRLRRP